MTTTPLHLPEDRLFSSDATQRNIARRLYARVSALPNCPRASAPPMKTGMNESASEWANA
jgi:hypothetical protein